MRSPSCGKRKRVEMGCYDASMALGCCHFVELGIEVEQMLIAPSDAGDQGKGVGGVPIAAEGTLKT